MRGPAFRHARHKRVTSPLLSAMKNALNKEFDAQTAGSFKDIFKNAFPIMVGMLLEQLIGLTDVLFLGRYGEAELAGAGLGVIFVLLEFMLALGFCVAAQSEMAKANGAHDRQRVGVVFRQSALFLIGLGTLLAILGHLFLEPICKLLYASPATQATGHDYIYWRTLALPIGYLCFLARAFFMATLQTKILTWSSAVMVTVNCGLNAVLIFGYGPFPEMGIAGSAIASSISEFACLAVLLGWLAYKKQWFKATILGSWRPQWSLQVELFKLGRWLMLQEGIAFGVWLFFFSAIEHTNGERGLSVSNLVRQLGSIVFLFVHAFATTCGSIAANLYGANAKHRIDEVYWRGLKSCLMCMLPIGLMMALFPRQVLGLLTGFDDVINDAITPYYVMLVGYISTMPCYYTAFVIATLGYTRSSFRITITAAFVYTLYVLLLVYLEASTAVMWTTDWVYGWTLGLGAYWVWRRRSWKPQRVTAHSRS